MKFQTPLLLLASLISLVSGEAAPADTALESRVHARDFLNEVTESFSALDLSKRAAPVIPAGQDATKLHVWIRTDTRPTNYDDRSGARHDGLNQLIHDTGGRHKDVIVGNPSKGYYEYGLQFDGSSWQKKPNGDGAAISAYTGAYQEVPNGHEAYDHRGVVRDGRKTLNSISSIAHTEISGKVYNHQTYNCGNFATDMVGRLV